MKTLFLCIATIVTLVGTAPGLASMYKGPTIRAHDF